MPHHSNSPFSLVMKSFTSLILLISFLTIATAYFSVDPDTQHIIDEYGRVRIFHGVNAIYKVPPYYPQLEGFDPSRSLSPSDIAHLEEWGFNVVRLYVGWDAVEPERGHYNTTYLSVLNGLINRMGDAGIVTLLDAHQDLFSRRFCGEGSPLWVTENLTDPAQHSFPLPAVPAMYPFSKNGVPPLKLCVKHPFFEYYGSFDVSRTFQNFYENVNGTQDHFIEFWNQVSSYFKNNENVIGYELINEPWVGDIYSHPKYLKPGVADHDHLIPLYRAASRTIRRHDSRHLLFFEPTIGAGNEVFPAGFGDTPPLFQSGPGQQFSNQSVYSFHVYCPDVDQHGEPRDHAVCQASDAEMAGVRIDDAARMGNVGKFMTEFGAVSNTSGSAQEINTVAALADAGLFSWTYWQFKGFEDLTTANNDDGFTSEGFYNADGSIQKHKIKALSRTYAMAVSGIPHHMRFDPHSAVFHLRYRVTISSLTAGMPTVIYIPEAIHYPHGYQVQATSAGSGCGGVRWARRGKNRIHVSLDSNQMRPGCIVSVTINRQ
eukprot:gb/GECH01010437.1/.p1 GENE.gb/GECH01010437.1/~~gb/GECH01010437.1/.p1  ORF type:complete len:543 (+),score=93.68 gb/GECH01010437.1/:1-1629(+)